MLEIILVIHEECLKYIEIIHRINLRTTFELRGQSRIKNVEKGFKEKGKDS